MLRWKVNDSPATCRYLRQRNSQSVSLIYPGVLSNTPETWLETDLRGPLGLLAR